MNFVQSKDNIWTSLRVDPLFSKVVNHWVLCKYKQGKNILPGTWKTGFQIYE